MSFDWKTGSNRSIKTSNKGIKKIKEQWLWKPVKVGSGIERFGHQTGELLRDDMYTCGYCKGTGEKPKGYKCPVCKGKGSMSIEPPAVICAYCRGSGEEKPRSNITCTACRGRGIIHVEEPVEICPNCNGTGKEPSNKLVCIKCRGKGVITVKSNRIDKLNKEIEDINKFIIKKSDIYKSENKSEKEKPVSSASGSEREALEVVNKLGQADRVAVGRNISPPVSSAYAEQLCNALVRKKLLIKDGVFYRLTDYSKKMFKEK